MRCSHGIHMMMDDEHFAMLEAICANGEIAPGAMAKALLYAVLEDDAAMHGASVEDNKVVYLRNFSGVR